MPPNNLDILRTLSVGLCANGEVSLSHSPTLTRKYIISLINFDKRKHTDLICCTTTSKIDKVFPGEFLIPDLFGHGPSKVQPYNICRVVTDKLCDFTYIGVLDRLHLTKFEDGLKIAIKQKYFTPAEELYILHSWQPFFGS